MTLTELEYEAIERDFREWAFHAYFDGPYRDVKDSYLRFALALVASIAPIHDRQAVLAWSRLPNRKRLGAAAERIAHESIQRQSRERMVS